MIWQPGKMLQKGKYIIREVKTDRLSVAYLAETSDGEWALIKAPNDEAVQPPEFDRLQQVFVKEAFKLAQCRHPHIIRAEEPFQEDGIWCIPMEYIAGTTLDKRDRKILPESEAVRYICQIGEALVEVHRNNLLHRDVHPANIMLRIRDGQSEAVLIHFGLARKFDQDFTQTQTEEITPGYTPLELYSKQAKRGAYTDIYSLGATLYNLLTGEDPPKADDRKLTNARLKFTKEIRQLIKQAIKWAMALEGSDRPQSVREWLDMLIPEQRDENPNQPATSSDLTATQQKVNWPVIWAAVAAIGTFLTGLAVIPDLIDKVQDSPSNPSAFPSPTQTTTP